MHRLVSVLWLALFVLWTVGLLTPGPRMDAAEEGLALTKEESFWTGKVLHVGIYATLTALAGWLPVPAGRRWWLLVVLSLHAVGTEFGQQFVQRGSSWRDVGLNHLGIAVGVGLTWWRWRPGRGDSR